MKTASRPISERELVIPALVLIRDNPGISTSELISKLIVVFKPCEYDMSILDNRNDTHFSQKVRNLKSHNTISEYVEYSKNSWKLAEKGEEFLLANSDLVESFLVLINDTTFDIDDMLEASSIVSKAVRKNARKKHRYIVIDENQIIYEGKKIIVKETVVQKRSRELRNAAIQKFSNEDGTINCAICGAELSKEYGSYGKGFIEIHHKKPVCQYDDEDVKKTLGEAILNLVPLCPNCHRMVHRAKELSLKEFETMYKKINKGEK